MTLQASDKLQTFIKNLRRMLTDCCQTPRSSVPTPHLDQFLDMPIYLYHGRTIKDGQACSCS